MAAAGKLIIGRKANFRVGKVPTVTQDISLQTANGRAAAPIHELAEKGSSRKPVFISPHAYTVLGRISPYIQILGVAALLQEIYVRPLPREGEPTVREAKEVFLLVVDKVRDALLAQHHLKHVKGIGSPTSALAVTTESTHRPHSYT